MIFLRKEKNNSFKCEIALKNKKGVSMDKERYEIRMQLEKYNDIFSDFDSRSYSEKALSDDFLAEAKKASFDRPEEIDILFFLPKTKRDNKIEATIKKRLLAHFKHHHFILQKENKGIVRMGVLFLIVGVILMLLATYFLFQYEHNILASFGIILFEPASWFLFWEGLNLIIFTSKNKKPELDFYEKMSRTRIFFSTVE